MPQTPTWDNTEPTWDTTDAAAPVKVNPAVPQWEDTSPADQQTQPAQAQASTGTPTWDDTTPTWDHTEPVTEDKPSAYQRATDIRRTGKGGAIASEKITDDEIKDIAKQTGTDPERLKEFTNYFGVFNEGDESMGSAFKAIAGQAGKMAFGIPQKLMKMSQDSKYEDALDILGALAGQKQSYLLDITGALGGPNVVAGRALKAIAPEASSLVKSLAGAGEAVGTGAVAGAANADKGKELRGAVEGGAAGGVIAAVPAVIRSVRGTVNWSNKQIQEGIDNIKRNGANIEEAYAKALPERAPELDALKDLAKTPIKSYGEFNPDPELITSYVSKDAIDKAVTEGTPENKLVTDFLSKAKANVSGDIAEQVPGERLSQAVQDTTLSPEEAGKALGYLKLKSVSKELRRAYGAGLTELQATRPADLDNLLGQLDKTKFALQAVTGKGFEANLNPLERIGYKVMSYVSDSKPYLQVLDDRYGTSFERIADDASKKMNLIYGASVRKWAPEINQIAQMTKDPSTYGHIIADVESGNPVTSEGQALKSFFNNVLEDANSKGANIQVLKGEGYFPKLRKAPIEYIRSYRQEAQNIQQNLGIDFSDLTDKNIERFSEENPAFKTFVNETLKVGDFDKPTAENFKQGYLILNGDIAKARQALNLKSFAQQQRSKAELPLWAREMDPAKAASRWVTNTYKYLALKDEIGQLSNAEQIARKAKDTHAADYLRNLRQDWMGGRINTVSSWGKKQAEKWQINMDANKEKALAAGNTGIAKLYEGAKDLPDMFIRGQNNIYTNALGLSPKAALQNLSSFYTQNFPELGHATSMYYTAKALPQLGQLIRKGELGEFVYSKGLIDRDWTGEAANVLSGNLRKSLARQVSGKLAEHYSQTVMSAFKGSEMTGRAMMTLIAQNVGEDMFKNPALRNKIILNMKSSAYRRALQTALEGRDVEATKNILTSYLNSNNMYNYNKLNQAEFARSLGPMFSIFSKWPSVAVGSQMKDFMSGAGVTPAVIKSARLLYMPFLTMYIADKVADHTVKPMIGDNRYEVALGKKGLHGMMITDATPTGLFENKGGILASPAIRVAKSVAEAITGEGEFGQRFSKAAKDLATTYVPVLPLVDKVMNRDLPRVLYNQDPSKNKK